MNIPRCTGYTSLICNIKIYFIQRESQRVNIFSSINKMTALLVFGQIKNSVLVKHCPRTQWIWAFNIILNFLANTPFTFGHKKDCLYGMRHLKWWNKFSPMTMHLNRKWIFQTGKIIEKLLPALISCETELLKARKWITNRITGFKSFLFGEITVHFKGKNPRVVFTFCSAEKRKNNGLY